MKVGNKNANLVLNILYANNHFEPTITCNPMIYISKIFTFVMHMTQNLKTVISIMKLMKFNINKKSLIGILN